MRGSANGNAGHAKLLQGPSTPSCGTCTVHVSDPDRHQRPARPLGDDASRWRRRHHGPGPSLHDAHPVARWFAGNQGGMRSRLPKGGSSPSFPNTRTAVACRRPSRRVGVWSRSIGRSAVRPRATASPASSGNPDPTHPCRSFTSPAREPTGRGEGYGEEGLRMTDGWVSTRRSTEVVLGSGTARSSSSTPAPQVLRTTPSVSPEDGRPASRRGGSGESSPRLGRQ